ncbi:dTDP-4-dehydrorhamnose reductase [Aquimarina gracilis]|uniref:dTDP-4-dehydrorhamnose reductase n=1 Tax=Aquimarina gracilis TaxID=874422 RepID=A0ABU6A0Y9_9FLAO|nr:dTDP-4-dehydrorhamnose reductase [Aquimarina gracilis]MEB3347752.1 dTDP-4-dehydrorhamnose reductase [Aquimarina gracilis]
MNSRTPIQILVTGAGGQLGQCIRKIGGDYDNLEIYFADSKKLDITQKQKIESLFIEKGFKVVINCAAYTNVEQAEKEPKKAFLINAEGAKNVAEVCKKHDAILIHISTDYVFDGKKRTPYTEEDVPNPINEYGKSKLLGEKYIQEILEKFFIIRTSWLYSEYRHNFFKIILQKSNIEKQFTITNSEIGTPTNANDLAAFILSLIRSNNKKYGIYHYSNQGETTWYHFAKEILRLSGKLGGIKLEKTDNYPTFAARPKYSVLSKEKIEKSLDMRVLRWQDSLEKLMNE